MCLFAYDSKFSKKIPVAKSMIKKCIFSNCIIFMVHIPFKKEKKIPYYFEEKLLFFPKPFPLGIDQ